MRDPTRYSYKPKYSLKRTCPKPPPGLTMTITIRVKIELPLLSMNTRQGNSSPGGLEKCQKAIFELDLSQKGDPD